MLKGELGIFLYHLGSSLLLVFAAGVLSLAGFVAIPIAVGMVALHGIYSMSFLELWSLAQGGYSVSILLAAVKNGDITRSDVMRFAAIGEAKRLARQEALLFGGLAVSEDGKLRLTRIGKVVALVLVLIANLAKVQKQG